MWFNYKQITFNTCNCCIVCPNYPVTKQKNHFGIAAMQWHWYPNAIMCHIDWAHTHAVAALAQCCILNFYGRLMGVLSQAEVHAGEPGRGPVASERLIPIKINIVKCPLIGRNDVHTHSHTHTPIHYAIAHAKSHACGQHCHMHTVSAHGVSATHSINQRKIVPRASIMHMVHDEPAAACRVRACAHMRVCLRLCSMPQRHLRCTCPDR